MNPDNIDAGVPALNEPGICVYTDGSKKNERTGAGIVFYEAGIPIERKGQALFYASRLLRPNSVFQAEVWAIKKAAELMLEQLEDAQIPTELQWINEGYEVKFYSDSQAALKALKAVTIKSQLVFDTVETLNSLAAHLGSVTLKWVRG